MFLNKKERNYSAIGKTKRALMGPCQIGDKPLNAV